MRWLHCSYPELMALPDGYIEVAVEQSKKEARDARDRQRQSQLRRKR